MRCVVVLEVHWTYEPWSRRCSDSTRKSWGLASAVGCSSAHSQENNRPVRRYSRMRSVDPQDGANFEFLRRHRCERSGRTATSRGMRLAIASDRQGKGDSMVEIRLQRNEHVPEILTLIAVEAGRSPEVRQRAQSRSGRSCKVMTCASPLQAVSIFLHGRGPKLGAIQILHAGLIAIPASKGWQSAFVHPKNHLSAAHQPHLSHCTNPRVDFGISVWSPSLGSNKRVLKVKLVAKTSSSPWLSQASWCLHCGPWKERKAYALHRRGHDFRPQRKKESS